MVAYKTLGSKYGYDIYILDSEIIARGQKHIHRMPLIDLLNITVDDFMDIPVWKRAMIVSLMNTW